MNETRSSWKEAIRRIVPPVARDERDVILRLGNTAGRLYAQLRLLDWLGFRRGNATTAPPASRNLAFVCSGNMIRSPMAEALFLDAIRSKGLVGIQAISAGLHAIPGNPAHPWALTASEEMGVSLRSHRARPLTSEIVERADAIFTMDFQNKAEMLAIFPQAKHKILILSSYAEGEAYCREIVDPYFGDLDTTRRCFKGINTCVSKLVCALAAHDQRRSVESSICS